jgi:hypothetical protein
MVKVIADILTACILASPLALVLGLILVARWRKSHQVALVAEARRLADIAYWLNRWRHARGDDLPGAVLDALGVPLAWLTVFPPQSPAERYAAVRSELWAWKGATHPVAAYRLGLLDPEGHIQRQIKMSDGIARMGFPVQW